MPTVAGDRWSRYRFFILVTFIVLCFLGGGGSRGDIMSLLYLRPAGVICLAAILLIPGRIDWHVVRFPLALLGAAALLMLVQLIPLPPELWTKLPGRSLFNEAADVANIRQPWRPISVTPDFTLNSLAALLIPLTVLVGYASVSDEQRKRLLPVILVGVVLSTLLGVAQFAGGPGSPLYTYAITNPEVPVGLFANRNHQAVFLAMAIPMLAYWAVRPQGDQKGQRRRLGFAMVSSATLYPLILATGSRTGLVLAIVATALAYAQFIGNRPPLALLGSRRRGSAIFYVPVMFAVIASVVAVLLARDVALQRLLESDQQADLRVENLHLYWRIGTEFFPYGSGFGSFSAVFQIYEPDESLGSRYMNHAHTEPVDLLIMGGLPAAVIMIIFLLWWLKRTGVAWRRAQAFTSERGFLRIGSIITFLLMLASLTDYPLRTPLLSAVFAIACGWLGGGTVTGEIRKRRRLTP